ILVDSPAIKTKSPDKGAPTFSRWVAFSKGFRAIIFDKFLKILPALIGFMLGAATVFFLTYSQKTPPGISYAELALFHQHLQNQDHAAAEQIVNNLGDQVPVEIANLARQIVQASRDNLISNLRQQAMNAFDKKDFAAALSSSEKILSHIKSDPDANFLAAESLRQMGQLSEAATYYENFTPVRADDPRIDDSLFWRAEALLIEEKIDEARLLFRQVTENINSDFENSATRRLAELETR
ncbi:MAG: hypothetical protein ABH826_02925, partial [Patescibacteria group bacterium]